jgi:predicted PurR-regulated permease PerM
MPPKPTLRNLIGILGFILLALGLWKFKSLVGLLLLSVAISFIGRPIVLLLSKISFRGRTMPTAVGAAVSMLVLFGSTLGIIQLFAPLVNEQIDAVQQLDLDQLATATGQSTLWLDEYFGAINFSGDNRSNSEYVLEQLESSLKFEELGQRISGLLAQIGSLFFGIFSVVFMAFFFLKDGALFRNMIEAITPDELMPKVQSILERTSQLLTRYFGGLVIQVAIVTAIVTAGLELVGAEHAFLIGLLAGLCNLVPYLGPLAGTALGLTLVALSGPAATSGAMIGGSLLVFAIAQLVDNFFTQPVVFANRVHAHPLEIFIVISIAGSAAGILGMVLAVPAYTLFRIVAQELFSGFKLVDRLTQNLK